MDKDGDGLETTVGVGHEKVALEGIAVSGPGVFRFIVKGTVLVAEDAGEVHEVVVGGLAAVESGLPSGIIYFHLGDGGDEGGKLVALLIGGEGGPLGDFGVNHLPGVVGGENGKSGTVLESGVADVAVPADGIAVLEGVADDEHEFVDGEVVVPLVHPVVGDGKLDLLCRR